MSDQQIQIAFNEIKKLWNALRLVIGRGRSSTSVNDSGVVRTVQVNLGYNQVKDNVPVMQHWGFASNFPAASDLVLGYIAGDRSNGCVIASNNQTYNVKNLGDGCTVVYDANGNTVTLTPQGITVDSPIAVKILAPDIEIRAVNTLKYEAGGNGTIITPTTRTDYVIGSTNTSEPLHPPNIP